MTIREALLAMGYREQRSGKWFKPIGYQCFMYDEVNDTLINYFKGADGKIHTWNSNKLRHKDDPPDYDDYLDRIKLFECYTRTDIHATNSNFEFLAIDI